MHLLIFLVFIPPLNEILLARDMSRFPSPRVISPATIATRSLGVFKGNLRRMGDLQFDVKIDPIYSAAQQNLIERALRLAMLRIVHPTVIECAFQASQRDVPFSWLIFLDQIQNALSVDFHENQPRPLFLSTYRADVSSAGLSYFNWFNETFEYFYLALNRDLLGAHDWPQGESEGYWAGVIVHEILHHLGYDHPEENALSEYFIMNFGYCVWHNGEKAFRP